MPFLHHKKDIGFLVTDNTGNNLMKYNFTNTAHEYYKGEDCDFIAKSTLYGDNRDFAAASEGFAVDPLGRFIIFCDGANDRIIKYTIDFHFIMSSKGINDAYGNPYFDNCNAIALTSDGKYALITSYDRHRVVKISTDDLSYIDNYGNLLGLPGSGNDEFQNPWGIAISPDDLYFVVVDRGNHRIKKHLLADGSYLAKIGSSGSGDDQFSSPLGCCIDSTGTYVIISDYGNHRIKKHLLSDLSYVAKLGSSGTGDNNFSSPKGVTMTDDNFHIIVTDSSNHRLKWHLLTDLSFVREFGSSGSGNDNFSNPCQPKVLGRYVFIDDKSNNRIVKRIADDWIHQKFALDLAQNTIDGTTLSAPMGCCISRDLEYAFVCDKGNARLLKVNYKNLVIETSRVIANPDGTNYPLFCKADNDYLYCLWWFDATAGPGSDSWYIIKHNISDLSTVSSKNVRSYTDINYAKFDFTFDDLYLIIDMNSRFYKIRKSDFSEIVYSGLYGGSADLLVFSDTQFYTFFSGAGGSVDINILTTMNPTTIAYKTYTELRLTTPRKAMYYKNLDLIFIADAGDNTIKIYDVDLNYLWEWGNWSGETWSAINGIAIEESYGIYSLTKLSENILTLDANHYYNKLVKYLPSFIEINEVLTAILKGFQAVFKEIKENINANETDALINYRYQGQALYQDAVEKKLYLKGIANEWEWQYYLERHLAINQLRGTHIGLQEDLERLLGISATISVTIFPPDDCSWILDINYPEIYHDSYDADSPSSCLTCVDMILIEIEDTKNYNKKYVENLILRRLLPANVAPIIVWS